jgi:hypothetical protein
MKNMVLMLLHQIMAIYLKFKIITIVNLKLIESNNLTIDNKKYRSI